MRRFLYVLFILGLFVNSSFAMKRASDREDPSSLSQNADVTPKKRKSNSMNQEKGRMFYTSSALWKRRVQEAKEKFNTKDEEAKKEGVRDIKELIESHHARIGEILPLLFPRQESSRENLAGTEYFRDGPYIKSAFLMVRDDKSVSLLTRLRIATAYSLHDPSGCDHFAALLSEIGDDDKIKKEAVMLFRKLKLSWGYEKSMFKEACEEFLGPLSEGTDS